MRKGFSVAVVKMPPLHIAGGKTGKLHLRAQQVAAVTLKLRAACIRCILTDGRLVKIAYHINRFARCQAVQTDIDAAPGVVAETNFRRRQHATTDGKPPTPKARSRILQG